MKNIKENTIAFFIGALIFGTIGVGAATIASGVVTFDNTNVNTNATTVEEALNELYDKAKDIHKVTFNPGEHGTVSPTSKKVKTGETYGTLPTPTISLSDYSFLGWYTEASGGTQITSSTTVNLSNDQTLYAHWYWLCFVAGTQVKTINGFKNIEDIKVGDYVLAIDFNNNIKEYKKVLKTIESQTDELYSITVNGEIISASPRHQFYVVDKGWIRAYDLKVGDMLVAKNVEMPITHINHQIDLDVIPTYNLTVEGFHTYLVTKSEILVHNASSLS